jgi:type IV secretory pathway VirB4 component
MNSHFKKTIIKNKDFEGSRFREEVFSKAVKAGKRTYFFDVKATRRNEYYLTITESKKQTSKEGSAYYEKHKIFLYKEDFESFSEGLKEIIDYIHENQPEIDHSDDDYSLADYTDVEFEDLSR